MSMPQLQSDLIWWNWCDCEWQKEENHVNICVRHQSWETQTRWQLRHLIKIIVVIIAMCYALLKEENLKYLSNSVWLTSSHKRRTTHCSHIFVGENTYIYLFSKTENNSSPWLQFHLLQVNDLSDCLAKWLFIPNQKNKKTWTPWRLWSIANSFRLANGWSFLEKTKCCVLICELILKSFFFLDVVLF